MQVLLGQEHFIEMLVAPVQCDRLQAPRVLLRLLHPALPWAVSSVQALLQGEWQALCGLWTQTSPE